jgi:hypothetical protein
MERELAKELRKCPMSTTDDLDALLAELNPPDGK